MARGWESKSVESQIETAREGLSAPGATLTDDKKKQRRELEGLALSRTRVLQQIENATHDGYRDSLKQALGELDRKIAALNSGK